MLFLDILRAKRDTLCEQLAALDALIAYESGNVECPKEELKEKVKSHRKFQTSVVNAYGQLMSDGKWHSTPWLQEKVIEVTGVRVSSSNISSARKSHEARFNRKMEMRGTRYTREWRDPVVPEKPGFELSSPVSKV